MDKRTVSVPLSVLAAAAGLAGGAYAASRPDSHANKAFSCEPERALISDAARRLHITPARLTNALKQAQIDQIDAAAASGSLPRLQAKAIKRQIEQSPGLSVGPGLLSAGVKGAQVKPPPGFPIPPVIPAPGLLSPPAIVTSAARYLGVSDGQLMQRIRRGESLAQIAKARGKSKSGLEHAITAAIKAQLEDALKARRIPRALEQKLLAGLTRHVQDIVSMTGPPGLPLAPSHIRMQLPAVSPAACFAGAVGPLPPPVLRIWMRPLQR